MSSVFEYAHDRRYVFTRTSLSSEFINPNVQFDVEIAAYLAVPTRPKKEIKHLHVRRYIYTNDAIPPLRIDNNRGASRENKRRAVRECAIAKVSSTARLYLTIKVYRVNDLIYTCERLCVYTSAKSAGEKERERISAHAREARSA